MRAECAKSQALIRTDHRPFSFANVRNYDISLWTGSQPWLARKFTWVGRVQMLEEPSAVPLRTHFLLRGGARPDALGISSANLMVPRLVMQHEARGREADRVNRR